jgi:hypothetical protein
MNEEELRLVAIGIAMDASEEGCGATALLEAAEAILAFLKGGREAPEASPAR